MKVTKKMKRFAALLIAAVVMLSGVPLPSVQAAGDAKGVDVLTFTVKNAKGNPVPGVKLEIYDGNTPTYKKLTSNASGMVRWTPELSDDVLAGRTLTVKPVGPETTDSPLTFEMRYIYSGVGRIEIKTINGQPASEVSDPVLVVKGGAAETQGNKKQLVVNVKDKKGNPVNDCAFVMKDEAFPDAVDGMAKYPSNGVVKFTLSDNMQFGGVIRVHSQSKETYTGNELTFTSKNKEFLTVNGEDYDGMKEYTIVVTKKGEEPEVPEVNKEALEQKITDAKAIKNENYTEASWNALQAAITAAEAVRDNADATQDDVDAQVTALEEAINGLKVNTPQGNKKVLVVRVEDKDGNPVDGCAFVIKDSAFPNALDGMAKYPSNGVVKFTLTDSSQLGGIIRVHSWSSADYEGNELTFTSKNKEFLTVNGEEYDGMKEYTIVVTKKGEEPEKPEVNKEALEQKITDAKAIKNENYTEASWNALQAAITAAEAVRDNADATQDDVDAQVTALEEAINGLKVNTPQGNKKVLVVRVEDKDGNPVDGCAFVIKDSAFPNALDGMAKYPSNGVVKFTLTDSSQLGGIIRVHSWSSADYEGNELTFTSKNKEFLTVNGEEYDGMKEYTIVVTKKGEEPEKPEVNKEALEQKITDAKAIKNENYTEASWNALQAAITAAEAVRDNADATQDDVDAQVTALEEAINGLKVNTPQGNKKVLVVRVEDKDGNPVDGCAFVIKDSAFPNALDGMAKYPSNGVVKFTLTDSSQLGGIIRVHSWSSADYEGNELTFTSKNKEFLTVNGEEYDGMKEYTIVVTKKGEEPEKPEVNKEALKQKITDAKAIKNENYTEASWNALQAAITAAEAVRDNADATQDDVDAQVTALETAINALEEKEPEKPEAVNKDELKKAIDAAKAIENENYTEASWNALQAAIAAAEAVRDDADATQDAVDAQVTALKKAVDGLKENSEKPNPEKPNTEKPNTNKPNPNKPNTNKPNANKPNVDKNENAAPKTGDSAPFVPCMAGMICAAAVAGMVLKKRKSFE